MSEPSERRQYATPPIEEALVSSGAAPAAEWLALVRAVEAEPVEDGSNHPAEAEIQAFIKKFGSESLVSLVFDSNVKTADFLRLLGRVYAVHTQTRKSLVHKGLVSNDVEVRDAAIQAAESWEDRALATILESHNEKIPWLAEYASRVASDLKG